ncbi:MAG: flavodoxin domain-containing protein [Candidatus Marinimicrobia bacterium]|nr:flavodoxin domain-containing protein [Candidatus Neomarinimicrobiota bacterium]
MSGIIIYSSIYGTTKNYAEKLGELMAWDVLSSKDAKVKDIKNFDTIVLASNIRVGKMGIKKWVNRHQNLLKQKKLLVLAVGGDSADNQKYYRESVLKNLETLGLDDKQIFGLGGRKIRAEFNRKDTFLFNMLDKMVKDPKAKEDILKDVDHVDMSLLDPIADQLKK